MEPPVVAVTLVEVLVVVVVPVSLGDLESGDVEVVAGVYEVIVKGQDRARLLALSNILSILAGCHSKTQSPSLPRFAVAPPDRGHSTHARHRE